MELWEASQSVGEVAKATVFPLKVLGLALVDLGTLAEYLAGTQPKKLSLSPSIQLPVGFQPPREPWPARAQGPTWPRSHCHCSSALDLRVPAPELLLCATARDFQASSEVSRQCLNFLRGQGKEEGSLFHQLQLHRGSCVWRGSARSHRT